MQLCVVPEKADWVIQYCGARYVIKYDTSRAYLSPKWYVKRCHDNAYSVRYYSRPAGAFMALSEGGIKWE